MWFRNLRLYRLAPDWGMALATLDGLLGRHPLAHCGSQDMQSLGWIFPRAPGSFVHSVNRQWLLALGVEQKLLPTTVVRQVAQERADEIEAEQGRQVGRKELRDLRERVTQELLPRAFSRRRTTWGWIDPINGWLAIDAGSDARAEEFLELLTRSVDGLPLRPLQAQLSPTTAMTEWLATGEAPSNFTVDRDLELRASGEGQATIRYVRHDLEGKEIQEHIAAGKTAVKLGMTWNDRVSFVLTEKLEVKRLGFLDILQEEAERSAAVGNGADEQFDVDFTLMTGELARLLDDLLIALGGEMQRE